MTSGADGSDSIHQALLARTGDRLKLIANYVAGFDHIDVKTASNHNIIVANTPYVLTEDTSVLAMALIPAVPRQAFAVERTMQVVGWNEWTPVCYLEHRIHGKRSGIMGTGRIC